jgi:glycosyltransferase involved in cell wall biosynthesis
MKDTVLQPKISIITTVFNAIGTIENTILSVLHQSYPNIEYIIIDGGSTDGTLDVINQYSGRLSAIVSENDKGIADGFNKGISMATGEWIGLINADDWYAADAVEIIINNVSDEDDVCCGNLALINCNGYRGMKNSRVSWLNFGMYIMHPTCFVRAYVYRRIGLYDTNLKIAMDFDMFLRIKQQGFRIKYINELIAFMSSGGASSDVVKMHREELTVMRRHLHDIDLLLATGFNYLNRLRWRYFYTDPFLLKTS